MEFQRVSDGQSVKPLFSIVTVCRNAADTIAASARSLGRQHFGDYEWLVIDGASTDATLAVVNDAGIVNTRVVSERDQGIYDAMNKAVGLALGEFVFFLNADDRFFDDGVLYDVANRLREQPKIDLLFGNVVVQKPELSTLKRHWYVNRQTILFEDLCHQAVFARRTLFQRVGMFALQWPTSADYDWFLRVYASGSCVEYFDRTIAYFMAGGMHTRNRQALAEEREAIRLQYISSTKLAVGILFSRIAHRFSRQLFNGMRVGESRMS